MSERPDGLDSVGFLAEARWNRAMAKWKEREYPARLAARELMRALKQLHASRPAQERLERAVEAALASAMLRSGLFERGEVAARTANGTGGANTSTRPSREG